MMVVFIFFGCFTGPIISIAEEERLETSDLDQLDLKIDFLDELEFPPISEKESMTEIEEIQEVSEISKDVEESNDISEKVVKDTTLDLDNSDLSIIGTGDNWILFINTLTNEVTLRLGGEVTNSKPWSKEIRNGIHHVEILDATLKGSFYRYFAFHEFPVLKTVKIEGCDLTEVTSFEGTFSYLRDENDRGRDIIEDGGIYFRNNRYSGTPKLTTTKEMFAYCPMSEIDVSSLDTSRVTTMQHMFNDARGIEKIDLSNFNTSSVTNLFGFFASASGIKKIDLSSFNTERVTNMGAMIYSNRNLVELDLSSFDTRKVTNDHLLFTSVSHIEKLSLGENWTRPLDNLDGKTYPNRLWVETETERVLGSAKNMFSYHRGERRIITYGYKSKLSMDAREGSFEGLKRLDQYKYSYEIYEEFVPTREGYVVEGWYSDPAFTSQKFDFSKPILWNDPGIIYAKWVENYTIIIPASISINDNSELKIEGINRGDKTLSIGIDQEKTSVSEDNKLALTNSADSTIKCFAAMSWNGSESNPKSDILTVLPSPEITEGTEILAVQAPSGDIQAGKYEGNIVFSVKYE